ncbi:MAG: preprotein translocase subunit SecY [Deltaproteobacteria bacterium]|jgi:preprotein translocase subunit SecY|nr:preprotein translocase subunit SecY [Deltaproteobacteria bacterium]NOR10987.1 preprotein translocase subunit SecY [Desulfovibrionaceae bacterium]
MAGGLAAAATIPELRKRITFVLLMLAVYRAGVQIPTPGINGEALSAFFEKNASTLFGMFNMFSGGALENFSIFALGIMPYISASIIFQLLTVVVPQLEALKKEGEAGRNKITQYTRYATVGLSIIQGLMISIGLEGMAGPGGGEMIVITPGWTFRLMTILTLTTGTAFIMWLGEQMTERGIGNGISLIIFAGIVARLPAAIVNTFQMVGSGEMTVIFLPILLVFMGAVIGTIIFFETAQRRIPIQYAKRVVGRQMYGGQRTHLPLKINMSGVIPPIFASSIMMFPATIGGFIQIDWVQQVTAQLAWGSPLHTLLFVGMIVFFCFFYTAVTFNPVDVAENLKKNGGYVPGIRPGKRTAEFIDKIITRLTVIGAIYVSAVCVLPTILIQKINVPFYFGGTALLIVVGVAIDTLSQIESHSVSRNYDGFLKSGKIRGRR